MTGRPPRAILTLVLAAMLALAGASAWSTDAPGQASPAVVPVPGGRVLALDVGRSQAIMLQRAAREVIVAAPDIADVTLRTPTAAFIIAKKIGETTVYFFDGDGQQIDDIDVNVNFDAAAIAQALKTALPHDNISVSTANQSVVLTGSVMAQQDADSAQQIARQFVTDDKLVVNLIRIHDKNQVLLRVRVTEMQRNAIKELGITPGFPAPLQFEIGGISFDFAGQPTQFATTPYGNLAVGPPAPQGSYGLSAPPTISPFPSALAAPSHNFSALLQALEQNGLVKTLAEPNLIAVSGETASFLVGGKFALPTVVAVGATSQVVPEFYPYGVQLTFTPVVLSSGLISLRIATTVSETSTPTTIAGTTVPSLTERSATTTVELPSGGSVALAGLIQNDINNTIQGLPGLMSLPILGTLFSSKQFQHNETDLVIAVTAYLVRPTDPNTIAFPSDGFGPASDFNMYFLGKLNATYSKPTPESQPQPKGPFGFILE